LQVCSDYQNNVPIILGEETGLVNLPEVAMLLVDAAAGARLSVTSCKDGVLSCDLIR
jgi:hypothetical protein